VLIFLTLSVNLQFLSIDLLNVKLHDLLNVKLHWDDIHIHNRNYTCSINT
jgi:hypothetical protein